MSCTLRNLIRKSIIYRLDPLRLFDTVELVVSIVDIKSPNELNDGDLAVWHGERLANAVAWTELK